MNTPDPRTIVRYSAKHPLRSEAIQVRLVSASLDGPTQIRMTPDERKALELAAQKYSTNGHLSSFFREVGVAAAAQWHAQALEEVSSEYTVRHTIELAAAESNMLVGEWLRTVALEAIGFGRLTECCLTAREALATDSLSPVASDSEPPPAVTAKRGRGRPRKYPRPA